MSPTVIVQGFVVVTVAIFSVQPLIRARFAAHPEDLAVLYRNFAGRTLRQARPFPAGEDGAGRVPSPEDPSRDRR
jgi:hypothetical protein